MKKITLLTLFSLVSFSCFCQLVFENYISDNSVDERAKDMVQTTSGGFLIGGTYQQQDFFLANTDANGDTLWTGIYGGLDDESLYSVAEYQDGNFIAFGWSKSFGLGTISHYLLKIDKNNGDTLWTRYYDYPGSQEGHGMALTNDGGFIMTGASFASGPDPDGFDMYVSRADANGDTLWTREFKGPNSDSGYDIIQTSDGNFVCSGRTASYGNGGYDIWVVKFDDNGDTLWTQTIGGSGDEETQDIIELQSGELMILGVTDSYGAGGDDYFLVKLSATGDSLWAKTYGGPGGDKARQIKETTDGGFVMTGQTADFGAFISGTRIIRTDSIGNTLWTYMYPGEEISYGYGITQTTTSEYVFSGFTWALMNGDMHLYIAKIDSCSPTFSSINVFSCEPYVSPSNNYTWTTSGTYTDTLTNVEGCDSIIAVNLTINNSNTGTDVITSCDSYTWIDGNTYTASNSTATDTLTNVAGCDSVVTLNLTIIYSTTATINPTACDSYTVPSGDETYNVTGTYLDTIPNATSCDSVLTINLTVNNSTTGTDVQTACDSYTWIDGITYTASNNTATDTLTNAAGCDSVVTLNLTLNAVDTSVTVSTDSLTANATSATYQWLDCNSNFATISGAINQVYTPSVSGSYAVVVIQNNCTDTSNCHNIIITGINEINVAHFSVIYPNPFSKQTTLQTDRVFNNAVLTIYTPFGQTVKQINNISEQTITLYLENLPSGLYFIRLTENNQLIMADKLVITD